MFKKDEKSIQPSIIQDSNAKFLKPDKKLSASPHPDLLKTNKIKIKQLEENRDMSI